MKRNLSKRIAITLLVLFICAFSVQNLAAITRNFKIELSTLFNGKYLKTIHTPASDNVVDEESPCEEETEDESETQIGPLAMLADVSHDLFSPFAQCSYHIMNADPASRQNTHQPLYLATRTFRI